MFHAGDNFELEPFFRFQVFGFGSYCEPFNSSCPCWDRFVNCLSGSDVIEDPQWFGVLDLEIDFNCTHVRGFLVFVKYWCFVNVIEVDAEMIFQVFVYDAVQGTNAVYRLILPPNI